MLRRVLLLAGTFAAVLGLSATAWATWSSHGLATGTAITGTLNPPTAVAATVGAGSSTVHVSWTAPTGTPAASRYYVVRIADAGGATAPACGTSATTTVSGTACDDTSVPDGSYHYTVTGVYHSWTATSAASSSVLVRTPARLGFGVQPSNAVAGAAISPAVTVAVDDASGNPVAVSGVQVTVAIGTNPGGGTLSGTLTASTDGTGVATFGSLSIDKAAAGYRLSASSSGLTAATSATFTISPAAATKFVFTSAPVSGAASSSATLGPITVQEQDAYGNPVNAAAGGRVVNLASNSAGTAVFAATSGGSSVTSVTIPAGSSSVGFYYGDTKAGTPTITASGSLTSATQTETITAGAPILCITINPACSGGAQVSITKGTSQGSTVSLQDAFGNPVLAASSITPTVSLAGSGSLTGSTSLTINAGQSASTGPFTYKAANGNGMTGTVTVSGGGFTATVTFKAIN